jgi:hypothetical protein
LFGSEFSPILEEPAVDPISYTSHHTLYSRKIQIHDPEA